MSADQGGFEYGLGDEPAEDARFADLPRVDVRVPDDARDLDDDLRAYHRELRRRADADAARPRATADSADAGRSGRMVVGVLALLLIIAGLAMMVSPRRDVVPRPPLAAAAAVGSPEAGLPGGLLPEVLVLVRGVERPLRDFRPAVIALVPAGCACESDLATLFSETGQYALRVYLTAAAVDPTQSHPDANGESTFRDLDRIAKAFGPNQVSVLHDPGAALQAAYEPRGLTLVLVAADGIVTEVRHGHSAVDGLSLGLARLSHPGVPVATSAGAGDART